MDVNWQHESRFKVRPTQVDQFGHLNNAAYLELYEWARWEWAEAGGLDVHEMVEKEGVGPAILHIDLRFEKELRVHQEVLVRTRAKDINRMRGIIHQAMFTPDGVRASEATFTFVMFHLKERKVVPMPRAMLALGTDLKRST